MVDSESFDDFASARTRRLFHHAYLLCGDWYEAQDLVQITLAKVYLAWRRIEQTENVDAYARTTLTRTFLSHRRLKRSSETPVAELPPDVGVTGDPDLRMALLEALRELPPRNRAVVVLRYFEGHNTEEVAEVLGMTVSAVKSLNSRSLIALRSTLGAARADLFNR